MHAGTLKMLDWEPRLKRWKQTVKQSSSQKVWIILKASRLCFEIIILLSLSLYHLMLQKFLMMIFEMRLSYYKQLIYSSKNLLKESFFFFSRVNNWQL